MNHVDKFIIGKVIFLIVLINPLILFAQNGIKQDDPSNYAWKTVGYAGFSTGIAYWTSIACSPDGEPYVAYRNIGYSGKATVMKFNGTNWVNVGNQDFLKDKPFIPALLLVQLVNLMWLILIMEVLTNPL